VPTYYTVRVLPRPGSSDVDVLLISAPEPLPLARLDSLRGRLPNDVSVERMLHPNKTEAIKRGHTIGIERGWLWVAPSHD
jgi:hypothetical protein